MSGEVAAVVVAGGRGRRLGRPEPKAFVPLAGRPMLAYSLEALRGVDGVGELVVVLPEGQERALVGTWAELESRYQVSASVAGGEHRWQSVAAGLEALTGDSELVLIHDAARPLVTPELIEAVVRRAADVGAAIAAQPLTDTLKETDEHLLIQRTLDRSRYWRAETPQVFRRSLILKAYRRAGDLQSCGSAPTGVPAGRRVGPTDDAQLVEALGAPVAVVPSPSPNPKITTPEDLLLAEQLLSGRSSGT